LVPTLSTAYDYNTNTKLYNKQKMKGQLHHRKTKIMRHRLH